MSPLFRSFVRSLASDGFESLLDSGSLRPATISAGQPRGALRGGNRSHDMTIIYSRALASLSASSSVALRSDSIWLRALEGAQQSIDSFIVLQHHRLINEKRSQPSESLQYFFRRAASALLWILSEAHCCFGRRYVFIRSRTRFKLEAGEQALRGEQGKEKNGPFAIWRQPRRRAPPDCLQFGARTLMLLARLPRVSCARGRRLTTLASRRNLSAVCP